MAFTASDEVANQSDNLTASSAATDMIAIAATTVDAFDQATSKASTFAAVVPIGIVVDYEKAASTDAPLSHSGATTAAMTSLNQSLLFACAASANSASENTNTDSVWFQWQTSGLTADTAPATGSACDSTSSACHEGDTSCTTTIKNSSGYRGDNDAIAWVATVGNASLRSTETILSVTTCSSDAATSAGDIE